MPARKSVPEPTNAELADQIGDLAGRVDNLNLNGSAPALKSLASAAPALLRLADNVEPLVKLASVADYITASVEQRREQEIVWKWLKRMLNPLASKVGAFVWLLISAVVFALVATHVH